MTCEIRALATSVALKHLGRGDIRVVVTLGPW